MLDSETKRRIDTCRDILVGKVPDPKSQVEQITIALIYKFMDDMDSEAAEIGGKRSFFVKGFEKYKWSKLLAPNMGGQDTLNLYSDAIDKMTENKNLPELFRDIFKNAYLPYRDPETLRAFLKEIDTFKYDHSERLGDAFEYLLSVLGSQGDAGQFRTPRHIIDFIVSIVDPQKNETILDPACGTAGFLISAWKHILKQNTKSRPGDSLKSEERKKLALNIRGYDISPDMVRLSLVNLYLHGFTDPHIYEYDTLTSEERWNEFYDVILANPPFMSPKGGIKPHKRFSIQAKRSEVLFVDYIAEHLSAKGRAGIIVPEGIVFQSQDAYTALRKMLVETSLVAVISLPAGCFNPYSGVKTSILILDKSTAKRAKNIAFFKVENDGFTLGAQRRAIEKNDLPSVRTELAAYLDALGNDRTSADPSPTMGLIVAKERIAGSGEYNLSGERYRQSAPRGHVFPLVNLGDVCELYQPKTITQEHLIVNGLYPVFGANGVIGRYDKFNHEEPEVLITCRGATCGTVNRSEPRSWITGNAMVVKPKDPRLSKNFLFSLLKASDLSSTISGSAQPQITRQGLAPFQIPLPPLSVQEEIVAEIEGYQKVINGARAVVENYRPHISVLPEWPMVAIGDLVESTLVGLVRNRAEQDPERAHPYIKMNNITSDGALDLDNLVYVDATSDEVVKYSLRDGDLIYNTRNAPDLVGKSAVFHGEGGRFLFNNNILRIRFGSRALPDFVNTVMNSDFGKEKIRAQVDGTTSVAALYQKNYLAIQIPLPPVAAQQQIVGEIKAEQALVAASRELIARFDKKIHASLSRVLGEVKPPDSGV